MPFGVHSIALPSCLRVWQPTFPFAQTTIDGLGRIASCRRLASNCANSTTVYILESSHGRQEVIHAVSNFHLLTTSPLAEIRAQYVTTDGEKYLGPECSHKTKQHTLTAITNHVTH
jgi:hypothetical protein